MDSMEIDDALYSRQRYVLGDSAMVRMARSSVFLSGMGGLGVEVAKNIVLAGIKSLTVHDTKTATVSDLGTQFFLRDDDVKEGRNRAEASVGRLAELNPYVTVKASSAPLGEDTDLSFLKEYQCVVLTEASLKLQLKVDTFCRSQDPPIKFVSGDVYGVFCCCFCDFGDEFEVCDATGEEPKEVFMAKVTKASPGVVTCLENRMHGFETGDIVTFKEVVGMDALNGTSHKINVISPYAFSICDTTAEKYQPYKHGGIARQVKVPTLINFESLEKQLTSPNLLTVDFAKMHAPSTIHLGMWALHKFQEEYSRLPKPGNSEDAAKLVELAQSLNSKMHEKVDNVDSRLLTWLSYTAQGCFAPLTAAMGGILAQEVLKALTGKFTPLKQWLYMDSVEVCQELESKLESLQPKGDRNDALRMCIGEDLLKKLASLKLFMVGCGAIGCEMLKNYALMGVASAADGMITITDNDLIEKSNLNRQFLFRPHHIRQPKSTTAAASALEINPDLHVNPHQHKVCPDTEEKLYNDTFFESQDLCVNALDNVEARRYMDSRCVSNQRALLESGTMGPKGHVQTIVPHLTESYGSQRDPVDHDVPYCTLKSFPAVIEHTIQWARDKFESMYSQKPSLYNKFWSTNGSPAEILQTLKGGAQLDGAVQSVKLLKNRPYRWADCVALARVKFEKYFNHKAKQLLYTFPLDTAMKDGTLFWQSPKRPPKPVDFNQEDDLHILFVLSCSRLLAGLCNIPVTDEDLTKAALLELLPTIKVPEFRPKSKTIETDESAKKPEQEEFSGDEVERSVHILEQLLQERDLNSNTLQMVPAVFEKDDDSNGHIDFITACSNLRARMYSIEEADRLKTKRIAGRIVPAIATTTAAVAGLVSIELVKVVLGSPLEHYRNCFLNLALPVMVFSEPAPPEKSVIREGLSVTLWDKWDVHGNKDFTLKQFLAYFKEKHGFEATMVVYGVKMVYVPIMPGHKKRLPQTMVKLIKPGAEKKYVDLTVSFEGEDGEDIPGPPVRYFFHL
ncbi:PREDICTED: ubiquitin-like modifier-activating enzyme 6 [Branchiostoma belcheri]|uniref:Ubiquitin-like modifier-activating enzyme 6 n=1 Tax=Branchiostoma belcheri TaxID=7741 RepID=A0A6P4YYZ0_BRABE|nr:PREDICTED: ubiquitin-like modifier-activating enzyme 6 [Branchiostoma belcheri]